LHRRDVWATERIFQGETGRELSERKAVITAKGGEEDGVAGVDPVLNLKYAPQG
jgi:hypothetical protein